MTTYVFADNATSTLASGVTAGATSLTLATGTGSKFPTPTGDERFTLRLGTDTSNEVVTCSARSGDVITCSATANSWDAGTAAILTLPSVVAENFVQRSEFVPGGSDQQFQYNNAGAFAGSPDLYYAYPVAGKTLHIGNPTTPPYRIDARAGTSLSFGCADTLQFSCTNGGMVAVESASGVYLEDFTGWGCSLVSAGFVSLLAPVTDISGVMGVNTGGGATPTFTLGFGNSATATVGIEPKTANTATYALKFYGQNRKTGVGNTNGAGGAIEYHAGLGTGSAASATHKFYCPIPGTSGTAAQSEANILTLTNALMTVSGGAIINSAGTATDDFQVQGDTEANMIFVDASADTVYLGGTTNGVSIAKGASLVLNGTATVWLDQLPTSYIQSTGGAAPNITLVGGSSNLRAQEFPNLSASEEYLPIWQLNHNWKEQSSVVPHLHLYVPDDGTGGDIVFGMYYVWSNIGDTSVSEVGPVYGTLTRAANAGIAANAILSFGSISGTGKTFSSILRAKIFRVQGGADTFSGTCWLLSGDLHIECDKLGTNNELS